MYTSSTGAVLGLTYFFAKDPLNISEQDKTLCLGITREEVTQTDKTSFSSVALSSCSPATSSSYDFSTEHMKYDAFSVPFKEVIQLILNIFLLASKTKNPKK